MKTKIWIILILITAALAVAYFYTNYKQPTPQKTDVTQSPKEVSIAEEVIKTSELTSDNPESVSDQSPANKTIDSTPASNKDEDIVKLIDSIEQNGALSTNEIQKLMSNPKAFDDALYKLEESYYEPEYSYETKVKYQHFFNTSPFHLQGKAQLSNLQCSPKMCLAKVTGLNDDERFKYAQSIQSSEDLPIKALAIGVSSSHVLLAFSTDPEVNAFITRKESNE